jgi:hypothetical protein
MAEDPRTNKYERQLAAIPREFRELATWGWTTLKPQIEKFAQQHGMTPPEAARLGARLSRLVITQMYGDISRGRKLPVVGRG